jgi:hypothetical protein
MSDLKEILKEEYLKEVNKLDIATLLEMVEDAVTTALEEEAPPEITPSSDEETIEMILKMIPNIEVSEIGWSDVRTPSDSEEIKGPQRKLLEDYLNNIQGSDFAEKIQSVSKFYTSGAEMIETQAGASRSDRIVQAISYLVFYKTLTKVITNFNASSAGFSFESFLAALVNGYQIPANTGTIADYIDRSSGQEIPVSLKLYKEGNLEVGGSYTDLVNDLVNPKYPQAIGGAMRYVVCTKTLTGDDLEQQGQIDFYQFDFTLKNVMDIISISKPKSKMCIMLPREIVSALKSGRVDDVNLSNRLPSESNLPSDEELEKNFISNLDKILKANNVQLSQMQTEELLQALNFAKNEEMFQDFTPKLGDEVVNKGVIRGRSKIDKGYVRDILKDFEWIPMQTSEGKKIGDFQLANALVKANNAVIDSLSKSRQADERAAEIKRMVSEGEFLDAEESARQYGMLGDRQKRVALRNTWGYLTTGHFSLNQNQSTSAAAPIKTQSLGSIMVGKQMVANVVENIRDILNEEVTEIFQSLKILSDSLNSFFAGGLKDDSLALSSRENAENISSKEILKSDK